MVLERLVHLYGALIDLQRLNASVQHTQFADEVHGIILGIAHDMKIPQEQAELRVGYTNSVISAQVNLALHAEEMGHTRPHDYCREGNVQQPRTYLQSFCIHLFIKSH